MGCQVEPADLNATGVFVMIAKNLLKNRVVMIAVAIIALTTLTAGTAAAAANKAKNIEAEGGVSFVGLVPGATVESAFKIAKKSGDIKHVKITTNGESVGGMIAVMTACDEKSEHSAGACDAAGDILNGGGVLSIHSSSAKLKVTQQPALYFGVGPQVIYGTLKGRLNAALEITGANGELLSGFANLKIRSTALESAYGCMLGVDDDFVTPVWGLIQACIDSPGPNALSHYLDPTLGTGPVMVPVELHIKDTGMFKVTSDMTEMKGKLSVTVDSVGGSASGVILITKGQATFAHDHD